MPDGSRESYVTRVTNDMAVVQTLKLMISHASSVLYCQLLHPFHEVVAELWLNFAELDLSKTEAKAAGRPCPRTPSEYAIGCLISHGFSCQFQHGANGACPRLVVFAIARSRHGKFEMRRKPFSCEVLIVTIRKSSSLQASHHRKGQPLLGPSCEKGCCFGPAAAFHVTLETFRNGRRQGDGGFGIGSTRRVQHAEMWVMKLEMRCSAMRLGLSGSRTFRRLDLWRFGGPCAVENPTATRTFHHTHHQSNAARAFSSCVLSVLAHVLGCGFVSSCETASPYCKVSDPYHHSLLRAVFDGTIIIGVVVSEEQLQKVQLCASIEPCASTLVNISLSSHTCSCSTWTTYQACASMTKCERSLTVAETDPSWGKPLPIVNEYIL